MSRAILIVDDSEDDTQLLERVLKRGGLLNPVRALESAEDAKCYVEGKPPYDDREKWPQPSVLFVDIRLPGTSGFDFVKWCKAKGDCREALFVVLSGLSDMATVRRAYEAGANAVLIKPCRLVDLENLIHEFPQHWDRQAK